MQWRHGYVYHTTALAHWMWPQLWCVWDQQEAGCRACGTQLSATEQVLDDLERVVIRCVYYDLKHNTLRLREVRAAKWRLQKKNHHSTSPSLGPHLEHANYLSYLQKHFHLQSHPSTIGHGWHLVYGLCLLIHFTQPPLPTSTTLVTNPQSEEDSESDDYSKSNSDNSSCSDTDSDSEKWHTSYIYILW